MTTWLAFAQRNILSDSSDSSDSYILDYTFSDS